MSESERTNAYKSNAGDGLPSEGLTARDRQARRHVNDQLLDTGQFVECIFSCQACGLSGTSIARAHMLVGKTCAACGELVVVTTV
ncbi:MAG: hypothetical protein ACLP8S_25085 [Solirubrobacteraceae bacterium]